MIGGTVSAVVVRLHDIGGGRWRVLNDVFPSDDVRSLLGFVEFRDGRFEVVELGSPCTTWYFPTLAAVERKFARQPARSLDHRWE